MPCGGVCATVACVPEDLEDELPLAYAVTLRLARAGEPDTVIATALRIDPAGVPALKRLALAKLAALQRATDR